MLLNDTFSPKFQARFDVMLDLESCLLVFDGSCVEIFIDKEFIRLATAGTSEIFECYTRYIQPCQQSKWSGTIDPNTTHIIFNCRTLSFVNNTKNNMTKLHNEVV